MSVSRLICRLFGHRWDGLVCTRAACRGREDATRIWVPSREAMRRHNADMEAFTRKQYEREDNGR